MFWAYALYSKSADKIYIGQTSDLERRLSEHNGATDHLSWTNKYKPWVLIYSESYDSRKSAMQREKQLKSSRGRAFLRSLIDTAGWSPSADPSADGLGS
jgi:putative endonuclease